jgi:hypothetical protein
MHPELAHFFVVENALADCEHLLLHFRGPVCDLSVRPVTAVTGRLRDLLVGQAVPLPPAVRASSDPYALLRFILAACPGLAARAEAEICQQEILPPRPPGPPRASGPCWTARPRSASSATCARRRSRATWPACTGTRWAGCG